MKFFLRNDKILFLIKILKLYFMALLQDKYNSLLK